MQVFKLYFKIIKNIIPVILILGILFALGAFAYSSVKSGDTAYYETARVHVAVVNYDGEDFLTQNFLNYLGDYCVLSSYFDEDELADALNFGEVEYVLTIPEGFGKDLLAGKEVFVEKNSTEKGMGSILTDNAVNRYLGVAKSCLESNPAMDEKELAEEVRQHLAPVTEVRMESAGKENEMNRFYNRYYNISSFIVLACCLFGVGTALLSTRNLSIQRRIRIAPISLENLNLQIIGCNLLFVLGIDVVFLLLGTLLGGKGSIHINVVLYWLNCFLFSLTSLGISYITALTVKSRAANVAAAVLLPLVLCFLGGAFLPQNLLGGSLLKFAAFTPVFWFVRGNNAIAGLSGMNSGYPGEIISVLAVEAGFAAAFFCICLVIGKARAQKGY